MFLLAAALYLNKFRGEPAIPGSKRFFTANLTSSQDIDIHEFGHAVIRIPAQG